MPRQVFLVDLSQARVSGPNCFVFPTPLNQAAGDGAPGPAGVVLPEDEGGALKRGQTEYRKSAVAWVSSGFMLTQSIIVKVVFGAVQEMLHSGLRIAAAEWEFTEMFKAAAGHPRKTLLGVSSSHELEDEAERSLRRLFYDTEFWTRIIAPLHRTQVAQHMVFQIFSAIVCCLRFYVRDIHANYPTATFRWLYHQDGISAACAAAGCTTRFDRFTRTWVEFWRASDGLDSAAARADLASACILAFQDNAPIEARHATIRRELLSLSMQTRPTNFVDLSCRHVLRRIRQTDALERRYYEVPPTVAEDGDPGPGVLKRRNDTGNTEARPKKKGRTGGAYRAFCSEQGRGDSRGFNKPGLAAAYRALPAQERERLLVKGAQGTRAGRTGHAAFGLTQSDVNRGLRRQRRHAQKAQMRNEVIMEFAGEPTPPESLLRLDDMPWEEGLRHVGELALRSQLRASVKKQVVQETLAKHRQDGRSEDGALLCLPPGIREHLAGECQPLPSTLPDSVTANLSHAHAPFTRVVASLSEALRCKNKHRLGSLLHPALDAVWGRIHKPFRKSEVHKLSATEGRGSPVWPCHIAGFCVCNDNGKCIELMHRRFAGALARRFPRGSSEQSALRSSEATLLLSGTEILPPDTHGPLAQKSVWVHVGFQMLKPVLSYFQMMQGPDFFPLDSREEVRLSGAWEFQADRRLFEDFSKSWRWTLRAFLMSSAKRPVGAMNPSVVIVTELPFRHPETQAIEFWSGAADVAKALKPRRARHRKGNGKGRGRRRSNRDRVGRAAGGEHGDSEQEGPGMALEDGSSSEFGEGHRPHDANEAAESDDSSERDSAGPVDPDLPDEAVVGELDDGAAFGEALFDNSPAESAAEAKKVVESKHATEPILCQLPCQGLNAFLG